MKNHYIAGALIWLLASFSSAAQTGNTGNFGGNTKGGEYINAPVTKGGDQVIGPYGDMLLDASALLNIYGSLTINQGAVLTLRSGAVLNLHGDVTVNGTIAAEAGAVINFYGQNWVNDATAQITNNAAVNGLPGNALYFTTPQPAVPSTWLTATPQLSAYSSKTQGQTIDGGSVPMNIDVYLNNTSNINLVNTDTKLAGRLVFNKAGSYLVINNNKIMFTATGTHTGSSVNRYIVTNMSSNSGGDVVKEDLLPGNKFLFPVGNSFPQDFTPAEITSTTGAADNYHVNVNSFTNSPLNLTVFQSVANIQRIWEAYAEKNIGAVTSSNLTLYHYMGLERNNYDIKESDVWFLTDNGVWMHKSSCGTEDSTDISGLTFYNKSVYSVELPNCGGCSTQGNGVYFTKTTCSSFIGVLAKTFMSFNANEDACNNKLTWALADAAQQAGYFDVERSIDGKNYTVIKKIPYIKGTTAYAATDDNVDAGTYYYRVKFSANGQESSYSAAAVTKNKCYASRAIQIYPNPAVYSFTVSVTGNSKVTDVDVLTSSGRLVKHVTNNAGNTISNINVSDLAAGLYLVRTTDANKVQVYKKLIIQNK